jgi:MFS family permease
VSAAPAAPEPLPAQPTSSAGLRPFRAGYWFGGFNGLTWMIGLGTPMVLLAERLGASAFQVGLASAFVFLLLPLQVLSTAALARLGYKRQMVLGWSCRLLFLLVPLALAWSAPAEPARWMPSLLVASVFGFCLLRAFGVAAHIPWMAAILPPELRGRFFATDHAIVSVVGVATLLALSGLFVWLPDWNAFVWTYGVAFVGSLLAVTSLLRLPDAPPPPPIPVRTLPGAAARLCLRPGPFRSYLLLTLLGACVTSSLQAFAAYYLKVEAGLPPSRILFLTALYFAGAIVGTWGIRRSIDRIHVRRFFQAAVLLIAAVDLFWLAYVSGVAALEAALPLAYLLFGMAFGLNNATHFTYLPELGGEDERPVVIAVFTATMGLLAGLAPILWGLYLKESGPEPGMDVARFAVYFAVGTALSLLLVPLFGRLHDPRSHAVGPRNARR